MKNVTFMAVAGLVGFIVTNFFRDIPGLKDTLVLIGTVASIGGAALGILAAKTRPRVIAVVIVACLSIFLIALIAFLHAASGVPGAAAAVVIYVCTLFIFVPIGLLIQLAGLKIT